MRRMVHRISRRISSIGPIRRIANSRIANSRIATRRIATHALLLGLLLAATALAGCKAVRQVAAKYPAPNIDLVYRPAAPDQVDQRNPLVVIPGFGGSELRATDGTIVWGSFYTDDSLSFDTPEGLRALALGRDLDLTQVEDTEALRRLAELDDDFGPARLLVHLRTEVVTEVELPVYAGILRALAGAGYSLRPSDLAASLEVPENTDGPPCYVFAYDWRRDIAASARELGRFLDGVRAEVAAERGLRGMDQRSVHLDLLAHSMGALVARYHLRYGDDDVVLEPDPPITWAGARDIDRLVMVGPPNRGTALALRNLSNGHDPLFAPAYEPSLITTWISVPQIFPRPEPGLLVDDEGRPIDLDIFDVAVWREHRWGPFRPDQVEVHRRLLPRVRSDEQRLRIMERLLDLSLRRGKAFHRVMDRPAPPPPGTTFHLFAGDADPTLARALVGRKNGRATLAFQGAKDLLTLPGDGSVERRSALADLRPAGARGWLHASVPWDTVVFLNDRHTSFLQNKVFQDNLLHLLLETPPVRVSAE